MHRPALVTAPATMPVTLAEAKAWLKVIELDGDGNPLPYEDDDLITALIAAVTDHLDGWTGILGRCLVEQEWRQDFDCFARCLPLPLWPVTSIVSVTWRDADAVASTVVAADYELMTDAGGRSYVRFKDDFSAPSDLYEVGAVSVTYKAGYPTVATISTVPPAIKTAMFLTVGHLYENRQAVTDGAMVELPLGAAAMLTPYGRMSI